MQQSTITTLSSHRRRSVRFAERFQGPPGMANGGYVAGTLATSARGPVTITLRRPVPLDRALYVEESETGSMLRDGDDILVTSERSAPDLDLPVPCTFGEAERAAARFRNETPHPFPECFVCGPDRAPGDGMRLMAGPIGDGAVAAAWEPSGDLCGGLSPGAAVPPPLIWAALDCPGAWGIFFQPLTEARPMVLGRITGMVIRSPRIGERCVVMGWATGQERRKHFCGTAVFDEDGRACAVAHSTWIAIG